MFSFLSIHVFAKVLPKFLFLFTTEITWFSTSFFSCWEQSRSTKYKPQGSLLSMLVRVTMLIIHCPFPHARSSPSSFQKLTSVLKTILSFIVNASRYVLQSALIMLSIILDKCSKQRWEFFTRYYTLPLILHSLCWCKLVISSSSHFYK